MRGFLRSTHHRSSLPPSSLCLSACLSVARALFLCVCARARTRVSVSATLTLSLSLSVPLSLSLSLSLSVCVSLSLCLCSVPHPAHLTASPTRPTGTGRTLSSAGLYTTRPKQRLGALGVCHSPFNLLKCEILSLRQTTVKIPIGDWVTTVRMAENAFQQSFGSYKTSLSLIRLIHTPRASWLLFNEDRCCDVGEAESVQRTKIKSEITPPSPKTRPDLGRGGRG